MKMPEKIEQWGPLDANILFCSWFYKTCKEISKEKWGTLWCPFYCEHDGYRLTGYFDDVEVNVRGKEAIETWINVEAKKQELWQMYENNIKDLQQIWQDFERLSENKKIDLISEYMAKWEEKFSLWGEISSIPEIANFGAPKYLRERIEGSVPKPDMNKALEALLAPTKLSFHQQAELEFLKIMYRSYNKPDWDKELEKYFEDWHWVDNTYLEVKKISVELWLEKFKDASQQKIEKRIKEIENITEATKKRKQAVMDKYKLNDGIKELADNLSFSIWWQDHRKGKLWWIISIVEIFSRYLAKKYDINLKDLHNYLLDEWYELAKTGKKVATDKIEKRYGYYTFLVAPGEYIEYYGQEARDYFAPFRAAHEGTLPDSDILKGVVACNALPLVRGTARIVMSPINAVFEDGEILVAPMTTPEYIHLMRKAKAVITDVGGLMQHAAIVSRELQVPCIVGTRQATKILKDGDEVEVDAGRGVVTIIKKGKTS